MKNGTHEEKQLIAYLLGQLPPEEQTRIEQRYLADPEFHEALRATERDLIDDYVHGELPNPKQFEEHFLSSPRRRQKVEFARALMQASAQSATKVKLRPQRLSWHQSLVLLLRRQPVWLPVATATALIILAAGSLLVNRQNENAPAPVAQGQQRPQIPPAPVDQPEVPQPNQPTPPVRVAAFILTPSLVRSDDETRTLIIERDSEVNLQLQLESTDYLSYQAVIRTPEGKEIWRQDALKPQRTASGQAIILAMPAGRFDNEDYMVRLSGIAAGGDLEDVSSYYFRARKR